jgi:hypothetical protein
MTVLILVSFVSGNWLVENLYKIAYPWFYVSFPIVLFSLSAFVMKRARSHIRAFGYGLLLSVSWVISLIIGRLVSAFLNLLQELFPFYQNPWVLALWADCFIILAAMVYAQSKVGKLMALMEPGKRFRSAR